MSQMEAVARDEFFDSLLGDFLDESGQLLDRLNENLLQLDEWVRSLDDDHRERCDDELMNEMFRSAHSLKGLSAMLGLGDINNLTHKIENVFDAARKDEMVFNGDVVELIFQGVDRLVSLVDVLKEPDAEAVECNSVIERIGELLQAAGAERKQSSQADAERALNDMIAEAAEPGVQADARQSESSQDAPEPAPTAAPEQTTPEGPSSEVDLFEGLEDETGVPSKYLSIFIDETELAVDNLTETFLALEGGGSREDLESLLITAHRIKGSAASVGLNRAAKLAHLMEDLLQNLVDTGGTLSAEVTDAMLKCTDEIRQYVDGLKQGEVGTDRFSQLARELLEAQRGGSLAADQPQQQVEAAPSPNSAPETETETEAETERPAATPLAISDELRKRVATAVPEGANALVGRVAFQPDLPLVGLKAQLIYEKLSQLGDLCYFDPPAEQLDAIEQLEDISFGLVTEKTADAVDPSLHVAGVQQVLIDPVAPDESAKPTEGATSSTISAAATGTESTPPGERPSSKAAAPKPAPKQRAERSGSAAQAKGRSGDGGNRPAETLRVDIERLDQLMNLAGQLVISKARLSQIGENLKNVLPNKQSVQALDNVLRTLEKIASCPNVPDDRQHLRAELKNLYSHARRIQSDLEPIRRNLESMVHVHGAINDLGEAVHHLDRVSEGIQQSVMDTRMVPIGPLFTRFKRVIRDITRTNGKTINLVINGEKTELDKRMIDELSDPLIHMVRNSADHGIELPEVRQAAGKPREGTVTLDAFHRGSSIVIQVTDDGKGLDPEVILRKALEKGLVSEADAERMTPHQIYQLIWEPGLSTAEKVTEVSGRGMGMDIVKSKIEGLNGAVDLDSTPVRGTTLTIKLPLTLAILPSLMVEIDGDVIAMPLESVSEIVGVKNEDLTTVHGQWTARVRGRVISVVKLDEVFSFNGSARHETSQQNGEIVLVIVGEGDHEIGLAVDRVVGEEDVVIKSMAENYQNVPGIAGASILGDGRVSLILDVIALTDMSSNQTSATVLQ